MKVHLILASVLFVQQLLAFGGPAKVEIEKVITGKIAPTVEYVATSLPIAKSKLSSTGSGLVLERYVSFGVPVQKNQVILVLDSKHLEVLRAQYVAKLNQVKADLKQSINGTRHEELAASRARWLRSQARLKESSASLQRVLGLFSKAATTAEDVDFKKREFEVAQAEETEAHKSFQLLQSGDRKERVSYLEARVREAEFLVKSIDLQIEDMTIKAPFSGIAGEVSVEVGDWIKTGDSIAELVDSSFLDLAVLVPEESISQIKKMQKVPVKFSSFPNLTNLEGLIVSIGPLATLQGKTIPVIVRVKNPGSVVAGMSARVKLPIGPALQRILVPKDAVLRTAGQKEVKVYVNDNSKAELRIVDVGEEFGTFLEVIKGLNVNDEVITRGNERLRPGGDLVLNKNSSGDASAAK